MPRKKRTIPETDRRFIKYKMKQIKKAEKAGNRPRAERHGVELLQYLGIEDHDGPVLDLLEDTDEMSEPFREKMRNLRL